MTKYIVRLSSEERNYLEAMIGKGSSTAYRNRRARILLLADRATGSRWGNAKIAEAVGVAERTVEHVKQELVERGLEGALESKKRTDTPKNKKFDGVSHARLMTLACSSPPLGRSRWTLQLLADKLVELKIVDSVCADTVRLELKKRVAAP
jgi:hypothetical protein